MRSGFVSSTLTNPIWFVKTRMQLDRSSKLSAWRCVSSIYHEKVMQAHFSIRRWLDASTPSAGSRRPRNTDVFLSLSMWFAIVKEWRLGCSESQSGAVGSKPETQTRQLGFTDQYDANVAHPSLIERVSVCRPLQGVLGFYKGISASYFGISETIVNFVLYEFLKSDLRRLRQNRLDAADPQNAGVQRAENEAIDFMIAGAISKTVACCLAYPHGETAVPFFCI